jgi:hypothetical protein
MGWCSGGELADQLWITVRNKLKPTDRVLIARAWVDIFESEDCDVMLETVVGDDAGIENGDDDRGSYFSWQK